MIQNQSLYHVEKMIRLQQEELNRRIRIGRHVKQIAPQNAAVRRLDETSPPLWHKWLKKRRLDTSWK